MSGPWNYKRHIQFCCLATSIILMMGFFSTTEANALSVSETGNTTDSMTMFFYHDSTIARTKWRTKEHLLGCELIDISNDQEGKILLQNLCKNNTLTEMNFNEMLELMNKCETIEKLTYAARNKSKSSNSMSSFILSGVAPGTKWCGKSNIAKNYSDLGTNTNVDGCCRQHDFCPVKMNPHSSKYDLTNESLYTISHCICDDLFFSCLKEINTTSSKLVGSLYFNTLEVPCLAGGYYHYQFRAAKSFTKSKTCT